MDLHLWNKYSSNVLQFQHQFGTGVVPPSFEDYKCFYVNSMQATATPGLPAVPPMQSLLPVNMNQQSMNQQSMNQQSMNQPTQDSRVNPQKKKGKREGWSKDQARVLVIQWKENFSLIESHKSNAGWA